MFDAAPVLSSLVSGPWSLCFDVLGVLGCSFLGVHFTELFLFVVSVTIPRKRTKETQKPRTPSIDETALGDTRHDVKEK